MKYPKLLNSENEDHNLFIMRQPWFAYTNNV